jgi:Sugar (and other) transporter
LIGSQWRYGYLVGVLPALLILWVRARVKEPVAWTRSDSAHEKRGSLIELFGDVRWRGRAIGGLLLAAVGLATYWALTVAGQDLVRMMAQAGGAEIDVARSEAKFAYTYVQSTGGLVGLLAFGPVCQWIGRKRAFALSYLLGLAIVPFACYVPRSYDQLLWVLPFYGAFTFSMHAGYAIYFPELFPTRLRALGSSVCLNGGRLLAAIVLPWAGYVKSLFGPSGLPQSLSLLSLAYLLGLVVIVFMPETKGQPLPEEELLPAAE